MTFRLRFSRRYHVWGPFWFNLNKKSASLTTRVGPVSHTRSTSGRRTTNISLPGKGASLRSVSTSQGRHRAQDEDSGRHRGQSEEERDLDARREALRARIEARRTNIRRMRNRQGDQE